MSKRKKSKTPRPKKLQFGQPLLIEGDTYELDSDGDMAFIHCVKTLRYKDLNAGDVVIAEDKGDDTRPFFVREDKTSLELFNDTQGSFEGLDYGGEKIDLHYDSIVKIIRKTGEVVEP